MQGRVKSSVPLPDSLRPKTSQQVAKSPRKQKATRPSTQSNMAVKKWRNTSFKSGNTASTREVELLGEWQNSVLAENLDTNENPMDVVTNAQQWYNITFNELVRQVSITCAERGRLFAVIWKRNLDLFAKMIELQKREREYILSCHKERVQFLKTDLDFASTRLKTIEDTYNEEKARMEDSYSKDESKFGGLQQKIDQQVEERQKLLDEISALKKQLGIPQKEKESNECDNAFSFTEDDLLSRLMALKSSGSKREDFAFALSDAAHFIDFSCCKTFTIRERFENLFLSVPRSYKPNVRPPQWVHNAITFIYSFVASCLARGDPHEMRRVPLQKFAYDAFLQAFGQRVIAEEALFDLLSSAQQMLDSGSQRESHFLRFLGLLEPLPPHALHFYLYSLNVISRINRGRMFPEVEARDEMVAGVPVNISNQACSQVLGQIASGRNLAFYIERVEKIALSGFLRFGGKNIAELDAILEYLLNAYSEETRRIEDSIKDQFSKLPQHAITSLEEYFSITSLIRPKIEQKRLSELMNDSIAKQKGFPIFFDSLLGTLNDYGLTSPIALSKEDFIADANPEDVIPFLKDAFNGYQAEFESIVSKLASEGDETTVKQLRASKSKFEQSIGGRATMRILEATVRDFFEKLFLTRIEKSF